jgi:hypothetical protein
MSGVTDRTFLILVVPVLAPACPAGPEDHANLTEAAWKRAILLYLETLKGRPLAS